MAVIPPHTLHSNRHMRSTILVRSTIHTRAVLLSIDQYMDVHQYFHNIVHFDFGLLLENRGESNTKMTSVVIARATGTGYSREKKSRRLYWNQVSYGWSPETHHKIWPKSARNRPLCTKNHENLSKFRFRKILKDVRPVWLRWEAPCFLIVWVGFTKIGTPCDVPDSVFGLYFVIFLFS